MQNFLGNSLKFAIEYGRLKFLLIVVLFVLMASACAGGPATSADADSNGENAAAYFNAEVELDEVAKGDLDELTETELALEQGEDASDTIISADTVAGVTASFIIDWFRSFMRSGRFWAG